MKRILDPSFRYTPSFDTDLRRTFERLRRQERSRRKACNAEGGPMNVLTLDRAKKREAK